MRLDPPPPLRTVATDNDEIGPGTFSWGLVVVATPQFGETARCDAVAAELNGRPRKTLGWEAPAERLHKLFAA
ncbi:hypothetical protein APR12_002695 [Nocardia amikacinitolerans]|nr:hypothetical protein [Nocardia amikacinitolerans]